MAKVGCPYESIALLEDYAQGCREAGHHCVVSKELGNVVEGFVIEHKKFLFEEEKKSDNSITDDFDPKSVELSFEGQHFQHDLTFCVDTIETTLYLGASTLFWRAF